MNNVIFDSSNLGLFVFFYYPFTVVVILAVQRKLNFVVSYVKSVLRPLPLKLPVAYFLCVPLAQSMQFVFI